MMADAGTFSGKVALDYAPPPTDLHNHLSVFYEFNADVPRFEDIERAGRAQFRVICAGDGEYRFADGHVQRAPAVHILGPTTGPTAVCIDGPVHMVGVGLLPVGWATLLDFEASLLVNRVIDAVELLGEAVRGATEAMCSAANFDERVRIGSALARKLIASGQSTASDFTRIVDDWLVSGPSPDVETLIATCGLSRRQVERRCNTYYGSPPKLLARKYRALKAAIALAKGEDMGSLVAQGFYDQSHFIREIKAFTGVTPTRIREDLPGLATLTLKRSTFDQLSPLVTRA